MYRKILTAALLAIVLIGCASPPSTATPAMPPTATSTLTPLPTVTATSTPSFTPTPDYKALARARYTSALGFAGKGDLKNALIEIEQAIRLDPDFADAYRVRGNLFDDTGDFDRAIADYSKAIELDPKNAKVYYERGLAYNRKRDFDRSFANFDQAIRLNPGYAEAYYWRGVIYGARQEIDKAVADLEKALELTQDAKVRQAVEAQLNQLPPPLAQVSFPIEVKGAGSCRMIVDQGSPDGKIFVVSGEGFEPNEEFSTTSRSGNEVITSKSKASAQGTWRHSVLPAVIGKTTGFASYAAIGKICNLKANYVWGVPAKK